MFRKLMSTTDDFTVTILRVLLGVVFFAHGAQKALGWFGGYGFTGTMGFFTQKLKLPRWRLPRSSSAASACWSAC
jgi:putative oxidoreductase